MKIFPIIVTSCIISLGLGGQVIHAQPSQSKTDLSLTLRNNFREAYKEKMQNLKKEYLKSQEKVQKNFAKSKNYEAITIIQEFLNSPDSPASIPADLPKEAADSANTYIQEKNKQEQEIKNSLIEAMRDKQAQYADKNQFDKVALMQKMVVLVKSLSPSELFSKKWTVPDIRLIGTWEVAPVKNTNHSTVITIRPDGQCTRLHNGARIDGFWHKDFIVQKKGNNEFVFYSPFIKEYLGRFHFLDENTFDMPWRGDSCVYTRKKAE